MKIIIIGATSGIGKELALLYAKAGHEVGITGRRNDLLTELAALHPDRFFISCFDATADNNLTQLKSLVDDLGGLDLLIYNAGFGEPSKDLIYETEVETTKINVTGFVAIAAFAFNFFAAKGGGQIAVTSSIAALRGSGWAPAYSASKAYMSNYAEGLNLKAARLKKNIVVTDIKPGFVDTKMAKGHGRFWVASPQKAALQIERAISKKRRVAYITKRWWLIAQIMKRLPYALFRRIA